MNMTTIGQIIDESVADRRFFTTATSAFAAVALLLTAIGLAVVVARAVVERRREMAIRAALGAQTSQLMALAMGHGLAPVVAGAGVGLSAALIGSRLLTQFLFGVTPRAPWAYALVGALVIVVGAAACLIPARRVTDASPASLLRAE
jgi:ABC-type antimicrobial peptide transport system permease subunit